MLPLKAEQLNTAAGVFADGFIRDPAFAEVLQGREDGRALLKQYFYNYISTCTDLLLFKYSQQDEGYLCLYRYDTAFTEFEVPAPLEKMEHFQILDEFYEKDYGVLDIMAVAEQSRGKGIGGKMIDHFVDYCTKENLLPLVEVFSESHLPLYFAHGFEVAHQRTRGNITTYVLEYRK